MKKLLILSALMSVICFFHACDDEKEGENPPPDTVKLVDSITIHTTDNAKEDYEMFYLFSYDQDKRVTKINTTEDGDVFDVHFQYGANRVIMTWLNESGARIYTLKDGVIQSMYKEDSADDITTITYSYSGNELVKVTGDYKAMDFIYHDTTDMIWKGKNLLSYDSRAFSNKPDYDKSYHEEFRASSVSNNTNIDLNAIFTERLMAVDIHKTTSGSSGTATYSDYIDLLGLFGQKSENILEPQGSVFHYTKDAEGYITEILIEGDNLTSRMIIRYK